MDKYKHPSNTAYLIKDLKGLLPWSMKQIRTIRKLKILWVVDPTISEIDLTEGEKSIVKNMQELLGPERKYFFEHKSTLEQTISYLYGLIGSSATHIWNRKSLGLTIMEWSQMNMTAFGCFSTWIQVPMAPTCHNMSTSQLWGLLYPYWKSSNNITSLMKAFLSV